MSSKYKDLRTLFHISESDAKRIYEECFNCKDTVHLDFKIGENQAFYVMDPAVYELIIMTMKLDRGID